MNNLRYPWVLLITLAFWLIFVVTHLLVIEPDRLMKGNDLVKMYGTVLLALWSASSLYYFIFLRKKK